MGTWNTLIEACEGLDDDVRPRFTAFVADEMLPTLFDAGVRLIVSDEAHIDACGGYFVADDIDPPELAIATGTPTWPQTFIHEFNHFWQWRDKADVWYDGLLPDGSYGSDLIELWYSNMVELNEEQLTRYFEPMLAVEVDCERRSIQTIEDYDLPFDTALYARQANAYLLMYSECRRRRAWTQPGRAPYRVPELLDRMSSDLYTFTYTTEPLPKDLQVLFDVCFEEGDPL
jgi:hypothetical protein